METYTSTYKHVQYTHTFVSQVMRPIAELPYLTLHSTFADAEALLNRCRGEEWLIPVVDGKVRKERFDFEFSV